MNSTRQLVSQKQLYCMMAFVFGFLFAFTPQLHARGIYKDKMPDAMNSLLFLKKLRQTPSVLHHQCELKKWLTEELRKQEKFCLVCNNQVFAFFSDSIGYENVRKNVADGMVSDGFSVHEDERIVWAEHNKEQLTAFLEEIAEALEDQPESNESFVQTIYLGDGKIRQHVIYVD